MLLLPLATSSVPSPLHLALPAPPTSDLVVFEYLIFSELLLRFEHVFHTTKCSLHNIWLQSRLLTNNIF